MYEIFYIGNPTETWDKIKKRFPRALKFESATYDQLVAKSFSKLFWVIWEDQEVLDDFKFDYIVPEWDRDYPHVFKQGDLYQGVCLLPKKGVSNKEFAERYFITKKEIDIQSSVPREFEKFVISNYDDYVNALNTSKADMFWIIYDDAEWIKTFKPAASYERNTTHVFMNRKKYGDTMDGVFLCSKYSILLKKEIDFRFPIDRKVHNDVASYWRYDKFHINSYEDYLAAYEKSRTDLFWVIFDDLKLNPDFEFDLVFDEGDDFNPTINHVFLNGKEYNGVILASKHDKLTRKEFDFRHVLERKEWPIVASLFVPYDIVFISYNEPDADERFEKLKIRFPNIKRVDKVKGIHKAHIEAAKLVTSKMFWVVDGDADVLESFDFIYQASEFDHDTVHVWASKNPLNELTYGYGGVKLLPTKMVLNMNTTTPDMTTAISKKFKSMSEVSNITKFNTSEFNTWKSAFRECVKLASRVIDNTEETQSRLDIWCTEANGDYAESALAGARAGREYGETHKGDTEALSKINDFDWLYDIYSKEKIIVNE